MTDKRGTLSEEIRKLNLDLSIPITRDTEGKVQPLMEYFQLAVIPDPSAEQGYRVQIHIAPSADEFDGGAPG